MREYQSNKVVHADEMTSTKWKEYRKKLTNYSDATLADGLDGYVVVYNPMTSSEYWSWSPRAEFDNGYKAIQIASTKIKATAKFA